MKYYKIKQQLESLVVFTLQDIYLADPGFRQATLYDWVKKEQIVQLRKNRYVFSDFLPKQLDYYLLGNQIFQPSYVSLELALYHYGIIPELVQETTSVTTRKTNTFITPLGTYVYQTITPAVFFGYKIINHNNRGILLATMEKSVLDYLYLHSQVQNLADFKELRWNRDSILSHLDMDIFDTYSQLFDNQALNSRVAVFKNYLQMKS